MDKVKQDEGVRRAIAALEPGDIQGAVRLAIENESKLTHEDFETLAEKAGDTFVTALNKALEKAGR